MKTKKQLLFNKLIIAFNSLQLIFAYLLASQIRFKENKLLPECKEMEALVSFCYNSKKFSRLHHDFCRRFGKIQTDEEQRKEYIKLLNQIAETPKLPSPSLNCTLYLFREFLPSFINQEFNPCGIVSVETGEIIYDFRNDTPETFLQRYLEEIEEKCS